MKKGRVLRESGVFKYDNSRFSGGSGGFCPGRTK